MVTKRTRLLSIVTTAIMLVSMLACFVIPASAETATLDELVYKYNEALDPANFNDTGVAALEEARTTINGYKASYDAEADETAREAFVTLANEADVNATAALQGTVNAEAELPYALKGYYEALGYSENATVYLITDYEDWMAAAAAAKGWSGITLKITADIDFTGKEAAPLTPACSDKDNPEVTFGGTLEGQGHKLINMNLSLTGCYAAAVVGYAKNATIKDLGIEGGTLAYTRGGTDWYSVGSFVGNGSGIKLLNCWSTMAISGANADGKTGTAGLIGMSESNTVIDNCYFAGSINNTTGPATDTIGYGGGYTGTKVYNTIGAGTLVAATNPVAMGGWHSNLWGDKNATTGVDETDAFTGAMDGTTRQVLYNSYAVGHDAIRFRVNAATLSQAKATYFGEAYSPATVNKIHSAASLEEAAWLINSNFDSPVQEEQTYFFDVVDGKLCFTTDANATLKKVTISGDAEAAIYLHAGETVNLVSDLGLQSQIISATIEGYEDAIDAEWNLTAPNADVEVVVVYDDDALLGAARGELQELIAKYEALGIDYFVVTEESNLPLWYEYAVSIVDTDSVDEIRAAIEWEATLTLTLKDDAKVPYSKKALYASYMASDRTVFGVYEKEDWIKITEDYYGLNCYLDIYVMNDIEFNSTKMSPLCANLSGGFKGNIYGQGYTFKNINIEFAGGTTQYSAVGLIASCLYGDGTDRHVIDGLGLTGTITNTSTAGSGSSYPYTGVFVGGKNYGYNITNCWADVDLIVPYTHGSNGAWAGFVAKVDSDNGAVDNCFFSGSFTSSNGNVHLFATGVHSNFINVGTLTGTSGSPVVTTVAGTNSYSVGVPYFAEGDALASAAEAAWKANTNWNSPVQSSQTYFYTVDANGELCFTKDANAVVRKVEFSGSVSGDRYYATGAEIDLSTIAAGAEYVVTTEGYESAIVDGVLTVPAADIAITVTGDVIDMAAYESAKAELEAFVAKIDALNLDLFTNSADMTAAKDAVAAVLAADEAESTDVTKQAVIDKAAEQTVVPALKSDAKVPYGKKALYADYMAEGTTTFGIYTEDDWIKLTEDYNGVNCYLDLYVMNDVEFTKKMIPLCADLSGGFKGNIYGQGHTFKNIQVEHAGGTTQYSAVGLIASCLYGDGTDRHVIDGLGLTGTITNTSTAGSGSNYPYTGVFVGGKNYGYNITNCWADVDLTVPYTHGSNGAYAGFVGKVDSDNGSIDNCYFSGSITSLNGNVHVFNTGVHSNFINVGTLTGTSGTPVATTVAGTNSYSVGVPYMEDVAALASAAEAAWKVNKNWTSSILTSQTYFFTVDDNGELCFTKDANDVVRKVEFTGDVSTAYYLKAGATITLAEVADNATFDIDGTPIDGATYTVPNADVTITVTSGSTIDLVAYAAAKAELEALVSKFGALNVDLFTNGADITAAKDAAAAVLAADAEGSTDDTKQAIIDEAAKDDVVPALKADAKVPYSKKALYTEYGASTTVFGIYEEADWNAMVAAGENSGITIYLMNNVTFTSASTTCINTFKGTFEGQGYTMSGINITEASGRFAGLFRINQGTIKNLKVDGTMNVTIGSAENYVQSIYAGIFGGQGGTVEGCTNSIDITLTAYVGNNNNNCIGGINGYLGSVSNSVNEGDMNVTLYLGGSSTRVMLAGIVGRSRGAANGCTNNGAINVTINGQVGSAYIAGIASDAVGTNAAGSINNGAITVTGGCYNYVGGILAPTGDIGTGSVAGAANNGDITVTGREGENIRINSVGGIVGSKQPLPAIAENATVTNTGDIIIDAQLAAQAYAYGIAFGATAGEGTYTVSNTGKVWIGGVKEAGATWAVGNTFADTTAENVGICAHGMGETTHIAETKTHKFECAECSYYEVADCDVTFTANDDLVVDGETVTATHTGACADCDKSYTENCVATNDEENQKYTFDCCDREDYVYGTPSCEHNQGETVWVDGTNTHVFVCDECGETVGEAESCEGYLTWAEDTDAKTHSAICTECGHAYIEDCVGTEKSDAADCTKDHWYEYDCDRENETIVGSGADAHDWSDWTTEGATEGYQRHDCNNCDAYEEELLPLDAPVIVITTNTGKAGQTGVEFTVTLTEAAVKSGTITLALPAWAENVNLVAGTNVSIDGLVATITGDVAAGSVLLTGTYDIDVLAGATAAITATAADMLDANGQAVEVEVASADAAIDVIVGDAKVDGAVNLIDAIAVLRSVADLDSEVNEANGDVDASGALTADDAVLIVRWWLGDPTYQGPEMGI